MSVRVTFQSDFAPDAKFSINFFEGELRNKNAVKVKAAPALRKILLSEIEIEDLSRANQFQV